MIFISVVNILTISSIIGSVRLSAANNLRLKASKTVVAPRTTTILRWLEMKASFQLPHIR